MKKYVCLACFHLWNSNIERSVIRCPTCHRRQGISYDKFRKAVDAAKTVMKKVAESPPPHRPPLEVIGFIPEMLEPVSEVAKKDFPSPLVPFNLFREVIRQAVRELKAETSKQNGGCP